MVSFTGQEKLHRPGKVFIQPVPQALDRLGFNLDDFAGVTKDFFQSDSLLKGHLYSGLKLRFRTPGLVRPTPPHPVTRYPTPYYPSPEFPVHFKLSLP